MIEPMNKVAISEKTKAIIQSALMSAALSGGGTFAANHNHRDAPAIAGAAALAGGVGGGLWTWLANRDLMDPEEVYHLPPDVMERFMAEHAQYGTKKSASAMLKESWQFWDNLKSKWDMLQSGHKNPLLEHNPVIEGWTKDTFGDNKFTQWFNKLDIPVRNALVGATVGGVGTGLTSLISGADHPLTNALAGAAAGGIIGGGGTWLANNWRNGPNSETQQAWNTVKNKATDAWDWTKGEAGDAWKWGKNLFGGGEAPAAPAAAAPAATPPVVAPPVAAPGTKPLSNSGKNTGTWPAY